MPPSTIDGPEAPRLPTNDRPFSAGCVFWFVVLGFALTTLFWPTFAPVRHQLINELKQVAGAITLNTDESPNVSTDTPPTYQIVLLGDTYYRLQVVTTPADQERGLSGRSSLPERSGMLFKFAKPGTYTFWMKGMLMPLDIVFVDRGKIVNIANNLPYPKTPNETPAAVKPTQAFTDAIEIPAGDADKLRLKIGQTISLEN